MGTEGLLSIASLLLIDNDRFDSMIELSVLLIADQFGAGYSAEIAVFLFFAE